MSSPKKSHFEGDYLIGLWTLIAAAAAVAASRGQLTAHESTVVGDWSGLLPECRTVIFQSGLFAREGEATLYRLPAGLENLVPCPRSLEIRSCCLGIMNPNSPHILMCHIRISHWMGVGYSKKFKIQLLRSDKIKVRRCYKRRTLCSVGWKDHSGKYPPTANFSQSSASRSR